MAFRSILTYKTNMITSQKIIGPSINRYALGKIFFDKVTFHRENLAKLQTNFKTLIGRANSFNRGLVITLLNREFLDLKGVFSKLKDKQAQKTFKPFKNAQDKLTKKQDEMFTAIADRYLRKCYLEHGLKYMIFRYLSAELRY